MTERDRIGADNMKKNRHQHLKKDTDPKRKRLKVLWWVIGIVFFLSVAALVGYLLYQQYVQRQMEAMAPPPVVITPTPSPTPTPPPTPIDVTPEPTPSPTPVPVDIPIDFETLQGINEDIVGWIEVEGTDISYAVLFDEDDLYYLDHNYKREYSFSGSIFMQHYNDAEFTDFNTVLYGHNMGSGTMFAQLHRFEKESFFDEHDTIIVYTPNARLTYHIFAAYRTDNSNQMVVFKYDTKEDREAYLERIFEHTYSNFDEDVPVTEEDRIITLSTCIGNPDYRYLVQGVLIADEYGVYSGEQTQP